MTLATASECEIITTCEAPSTTEVARARARSAMKACNFGGIAVSRSPDAAAIAPFLVYGSFERARRSVPRQTAEGANRAGSRLRTIARRSVIGRPGKIEALLGLDVRVTPMLAMNDPSAS